MFREIPAQNHKEVMSFICPIMGNRPQKRRSKVVSLSEFITGVKFHIPVIPAKALEIRHAQIYTIIGPSDVVGLDHLI